MPQALDQQGIQKVVEDFAAAATRALSAGFKIVEIHSAHGYLIHEFLSPLSNQRTDSYGGSFENRTRILREVIAAVHCVWSEKLPLFVRISGSDWIDGGWDIDQSVELVRQIGPLGVDLVDCSSGGNVATAQIPPDARLSSSVCRSHPQRRRDSHRGRGPHHDWRASRSHSRGREV